MKANLVLLTVLAGFRGRCLRGRTCGIHRAALPLRDRWTCERQVAEHGASRQGDQAGHDLPPFHAQRRAGPGDGAEVAPMADVCMDIWMAELDSPWDQPAIAVAADGNPSAARGEARAPRRDVCCSKRCANSSSPKASPSPWFVGHTAASAGRLGRATARSEVLPSATHYPAAEGEGRAPTSAGAGDYYHPPRCAAWSAARW